MNEFTLRQLEYFVAVVDTGSVTKAAKRVSVTQATVSMAISQLESALGTQLLIRHQSKGVVSTSTGLDIAAQARQMLEMADGIRSTASDGASQMRGPITVGCVSSLSPLIVPPLAAHFDSVSPDVDFRYQEGDAGQLQSALLDGRLDVAVIFSRQCARSVDCTKLADVALKVVLPSDHRLRERTEVAFSEIADESAILIDLPPSRDRSIEFMRAAGVEPRIRWTSTNLATVTSLVAGGLGYSLRYTLPTESSPIGAGVVEIPISDPIPDNAVCAVVPAGARLSARTSAAVEFLRTHFGTSAAANEPGAREDGELTAP